MAINTSSMKKLRKSAKLTQEQVAERLNVSRQTVAKWETGESLPDIDNCIALAQLYRVSLDDLVNYAKNPTSSNAPAGKHIFGVVKVDEKGRIVIPEKARDIFRIPSGSPTAPPWACPPVSIIRPRAGIWRMWALRRISG